MMAVAANISAWDEPSVATEAATCVGKEDSLTVRRPINQPL